MKTALISGISGQDGSYLAELLLEKGYTVHGIVKHSMTNPNKNIAHILHLLHIHEGDITDQIFMRNLLNKYEFDEVYHLAAQSHVALSFQMPRRTLEINYFATVYLLNNYFANMKKLGKKGKFYFAGTSELFGQQKAPQSEATPYIPVSPYAEAKKDCMEACEIFRKNGNFVSSGILFNHESPRRGLQFVTQKIIQAFQEYKQDNEKNVLVLGNLDAKRDWGYSKDYVKGMWMMLQHNEPDVFVLATNKTYTIKDFIHKTSKLSNVPIAIIENVKDFDKNYTDFLDLANADKSKLYILQSKEFYRPNEVHELQGDYSKAEKILGWKPETDLDSLIQKMLNENS